MQANKAVIERMRYKGLVCGLAPVYLDLFQEDEDSEMICAMVPRPKFGWFLGLTSWFWDKVALIANKHDYIGRYSIAITGYNAHYVPEEDGREVQDT